MFTFGSVCSGIESASVAWEPLGATPLWFSEIEKFPCAVLQHYWPHVPNLGDMTMLPDMVRRGEIKCPDVLVGGTPCFTAGHQVLTEFGYISIEDIKPGDRVITHEGRLKPVLRIGSKKTSVGVLKGVGITSGIKCTPNHPFLSVCFHNQNTRRNGVYAKVEHCGEPEWVTADNMPGRQWCALTSVNIPHENIPDEWMYLAGFYVGDGFIRGWEGKNKKNVVFGINEAKLAKFKEQVVNQHFFVTNEKTGPRVTICNTKFAEWLISNFGQYSYSKTIPSWLLSANNRDVFLKGYLDTDGHLNPNGWRAVTTSKSLANGIRDLANTLGFVSSTSFTETPDTTVIEGRTVNQRDYWTVNSFYADKSRKSRTRHGMILRKVQSFQITGEETVYNIEVADDNSYILDGIIVHNCQAFSVAGKQLSLDDARGQLTIVYGDLLNAIDETSDTHCVAVWENVPGVLSTSDNAFGWFLGMLAGEFTLVDITSGTAQPLEAQPGQSRQKWPKSGCVIGPKRTVAWRVLDAQYFGVAQRRRRVFVVASAREGFDPAEVLFEREGLRRDITPSRETRKDITRRVLPVLASGNDVVGTLMANAGSKKWLGNQEAFSGDYRILHPAYGVPGNWIGRIPENGGNATKPMFELPPCLTRTDRHGVSFNYRARYLLPIECERLQGFPDGHTAIPGAADGPRYKAIGNSKAVPVVQWIGWRIIKQVLFQGQ